MAKFRGQWSGQWGFILAAAGAAIGLGNIWKFPFEVGRGGGAAFVVMYLLFCFVLCFPGDDAHSVTTRALPGPTRLRLDLDGKRWLAE